MFKKWREFFKASKICKVGERGFTLIELMIVVAIIGLIGTIAGLQLIKRLDEAKVATTKTQIRSLSVALDDFRRVCGFYPTNEQGLEALMHKPTGRDCKNYDPDGFIKAKKLPQDAWDTDFSYSSDGNKFVIKSFGADKVEGGEGINKDISSDDI